MKAARWYRLLLRVYPPAFRERFGADLEELFVDLHRAHTERMPRADRVRFWRRIVADTVRQGFAERLRRRSRRLPLHAHRTKGPSFMQRILEDTGYAVRALRQQGWLSAVVLATLALAIAANSAIFTVVNGVLLRPLPYGEPDNVVMLYMVDATGRDQLLSVPDVDDLRGRLTTITGLSPMGAQTANLTGVGDPDRLRAGFVGADFFTTLRVQPIIGRGFAPGDDAPGARKTAILEYDVWQTRFGADPGIIGRSLVLNNEPHEVIGVLPRAFEFPIAENDIWLPFSSSPVQDRRRDSRYLLVFGRVADGVSFEQADAELKQAADALAQSYPETNARWSMRFADVHSLSVMFVRRNLQLLMGVVGCVLLIACANIANLLLARGSARQREIAVRAALGASRGRIVGQLLIESLIVAAAGGGIGLALGAALTDAMLTLLPTLPRGQFVAPDASVVAFTVAISLATGIAFGLFPALRFSRPDFPGALSTAARGGENRSAGRFRAALVVAELALSLVLVTGAGLFIQNLVRLTTVDLGYDPTNVLTLEYRLPRNKYSKPEQQLEFHQRVIAQIESLPGVHAAAISGSVPQSGNGSYVGSGKRRTRNRVARRCRARRPMSSAAAISALWVFRCSRDAPAARRTCHPALTA
jgi:putative ABC transport system permease protein